MEIFEEFIKVAAHLSLTPRGSVPKVHKTALTAEQHVV
jgi:hypothetical protein